MTMKIATTPLYNILIKHEGHNVFLKKFNDDIVLYCGDCAESLLRQQKPDPPKQVWSV